MNKEFFCEKMEDKVCIFNDNYFSKTFIFIRKSFRKLIRGNGILQEMQKRDTNFIEHTNMLKGKNDGLD